MNRKYAPILHTAFREKYPEGTIERYIKYCSDMGYSGISLEGKSAVPVNDIDRWIADYIENVKHIILEAKKRNIDVWLFDEWGYPSGTAAGKVIDSNEDYRSKTLHLSLDEILEKGECVEYKTNNRFISAAVWKVGRVGTAGDYISPAKELKPKDGVIRFTADDNYRVAAVSWEYISSGTHGVFCDDGRKEYGTIDLLNPKAVRCFIDNMHERYYAAFPELFGNGLCGFFYDEPFVAYPFPYSKSVFDEFIKEKGYDIKPYLPLLLIGGWYSLENTARLEDYRNVVCNMISCAFVKQLREWCEAHSVLLTGHQDLDNNIRGINTISGDFFKNSAESHSPGVDYIWNQINRNSFCDYARLAGSVKNLLGKAHASSESFAVTGYSMPADRMRYAMEQQMMRGIDLFYLMIAELDDKGEYTKLSMNNPQNMLFGKMLNKRINKVNELINQGISGADIAVYIPMNNVFMDGLKAGHPWTTSTLPYIWDKINSIAENICYTPLDYEYIWDGAIEELKIYRGSLKTKLGQRIKTIIIPGGIRLPEKTKNKLEEFMAKGGKVISVGKSVINLKTELIEDEKKLGAYIGHGVLKNETKNVSIRKRILKDENLYFVLNEGNEKQRIKFKKNVAEYPLGDVLYKTDIIKPGELRIFTDKYSAKLRNYNATVKILHWKMHIPGGEVKDIGSKLLDFREYIEPCYSGGIDFDAEIDVPFNCRADFDLGNIKYAAVFRVGDRSYKVPFSPFRVSVKLKKGISKVRLTIYNTEANSLIGTDEREKQSLQDKKIRAGMYEQDRFMLAGGFDEIITADLYDLD